ncbi:MAG: NAD-dependent epimerase/dehydratase family protein [Anaerolineae bacterium]|nr:NAD-dependent epimerase/dehydratase family protein [Anaerolineae bacterium]
MVSKRVLLTGADGFLGSHILRELVKKGYQVRAFLQANRDHATIHGLPYEPFYGDLLDETHIDKALEGCDFLVHTVAITDIWPYRSALQRKINFDVVKTIAAAAKRHHIQRMVHIGTANSFGYGSKTDPGDEATPYCFAKFGLDYMDSKKAAQDFLLNQVKENGLPVIIINPTFMVGEYDSKPGTGAMIVALMQEKVASYASGGRCYVYVADVAAAAVSALEKGRVGECYIAGNANLDYKEFFTMVSQTARVKMPKVKLPYPILLFSAGLAMLVSKFTKQPPLVSTAMIRIANEDQYYSSAKAIQELDMPQTPIETAVERSVQWFRENDYV